MRELRTFEAGEIENPAGNGVPAVVLKHLLPSRGSHA
jgi:hypothetical protein